MEEVSFYWMLNRPQLCPANRNPVYFGSGLLASMTCIKGKESPGGRVRKAHRLIINNFKSSRMRPPGQPPKPEYSNNQSHTVTQYTAPKRWLPTLNLCPATFTHSRFTSIQESAHCPSGFHSGNQFTIHLRPHSLTLFKCSRNNPTITNWM